MSSIICIIVIVKKILREGADKKMNFTAYIERQKSNIRARHAGETYLLEKGESTPVTESDRLFFELSALKGLNKRERLAYAREPMTDVQYV